MGKDQFKDKRVAVIGLSVEGIASTKYLVKKGAKVTVCDQRSEKEFAKDLISELKDKKIETRFGKNYLQNLEKYDLLVRAPGFPLWDKRLQVAVKKGVQLTSQTKLFFSLCQGKIIGVTGTKGKGTTATLIYELLKASGKKVFLGGNIGKPPFSFLEKVTPSTWVVLELSSFQLADLTLSPHIAVVLNITSDHLYSDSPLSPNYHLSQEDYLNSKINIVRYQKKSDFVVLNNDYQSLRQFKKYIRGDLWLNSLKEEVLKGAFVKNRAIYLAFNNKKQILCQVKKVQLRGTHNLENITAAVIAAFLAGAKLEVMPRLISSFKGLEHRLEFVRAVKGIKFYNDSFSTIPQTTIAAIRSFTEPIILICGGSEKGSDYSNLGKEIVKGNVKTVILIGKTGPKIKKSIFEAGRALHRGLPQLVNGPRTMDKIVKVAVKYTKRGAVVLLSPASASFDLFENYKERGFLFKKAVVSLK